jgi:uracil-DNA glycosylase family 4
MNSPFLDESDFAIIRGDEAPNKSRIKIKKLSCADCGLQGACQSPHFPYYGRGRKKILFILDTPSEKEDIFGEPWKGEYGKMLRRIIEDNCGINIERDCWTTFAVKCRNKNNIKNDHITACRKYLLQDIEELNPAVIIPFGYWPLMGVVGDRLDGKTVGKNIIDWSGEVIPDQTLLKYIIPVYEPHWLNLTQRYPDEVRIRQLCSWISHALGIRNDEIMQRDDKKRVKIIYDATKASAILEDLIDAGGPVAFDYETTGKKPYRQGHKIFTASISNGKKAWAFPFFDDHLFRMAWKLVLRQLPLIAHNAKFEWLWTKQLLGYFPARLQADTMLGLHVLANQKKVGLKWAAYAKFGIPDYDNDIVHYLECPKKEQEQYGANGFNLIEQAPIEKLLLYNGLDSLYTFWLHDYLEQNITKDTKTGYDFLSQASIRLGRAEYAGLRIDIDNVGRHQIELTERMDKLLYKTQMLAVAEGWNKPHDFRPSAKDDISYLLFNLLGFYSDKQTDKGGQSTDKETLEAIPHPIVGKILEWKKLQKLKDTYLKGLQVEAVNGIIHPFFNLHTVTSYRSSSDSPNFQNFPIRDKVTSKIIRELLYPHNGHKLIEWDYKGVEVVVAGCYSGDKNLIRYVSDSKTDMHRDIGEQIYLYERGELPDFDRGIAKNKFTFPEFYGSYFEQVAPDLWNYASTETKEHLRKKGFKTLKKFVSHIEAIEDDFWHNRFKGYNQWKKDEYARYLKRGFVTSHTGFIYYGPMRKNEVLNIAIQGSAHHILLRTFMKVSDKMYNNKMESKLMGQIHDSAVGSIAPDEEKEIDNYVWYFGTQEVRLAWDWIVAPLEIEKAATEIDAPWFTKKKIGILKKDGVVGK